MTSTGIRVGVSSCLLGNEVRFDGGHKHDRYITGTLGQFFTWVPVCPEVECGLPVPREAMRLLGRKESPRLVTVNTGVDLTDKMLTYARRRVAELAHEDLCGYIFKSGSPSSGMQGVRLYDANGVPAKVAVGLFAREFMNAFPLIPCEDEGRLHDMGLRENFIERVFAWRRWRDFLAGGRRPSDLVAFHAREKMLLMAHSVKHLRELGRLVAEAGSIKGRGTDLFDRYGETFMTALKTHATPKKHANVLSHLQGFLKDQLTTPDKQELVEVIESYRTGQVPLIVPLTLLNHHFRHHPVDWVADQTYLHPYPGELLLRNHV